MSTNVKLTSPPKVTPGNVVSAGDSSVTRDRTDARFEVPDVEVSRHPGIGFEVKWRSLMVPHSGVFWVGMVSFRVPKKEVRSVASLW